MIELFANNGYPDQTPRSAASDLGLRLFAKTFLGVSRLQWVKSVLIRVKPQLTNHIRVSRCLRLLCAHGIFKTMSGDKLLKIAFGNKEQTKERKT